MAGKTPPLLTPEQRLLLTSIPEDLSEEALRHYYTLGPDDLAFVKRQHSSYNRLGIALQLCLLRFPGRVFTDFSTVPPRVVTYVAEQLNVSPEVLVRYGQRPNTRSDHLAHLREEIGYRVYDGSVMLQLTRHLLPLALESAAALPLIEATLAWLRAEQVIAPGITTLERLVWRVQRIARHRVYTRLTEPLTAVQRRCLNQMLAVEEGDDDHSTSLAWLRRPGRKPSVRGMDHLLERLAFVRELDLPSLPTPVHPNYVRQLAHHCRHYGAQPLLTFPARQREALLLAYLHELESDLVDAVLDMFDRWFGDLLRQGRNAQKHHLYTHVTTLNRDLNTMTTALAAFLKARQEDLDPFETVFAVVDEAELEATLTSARQIMRPADLDFRDLLVHRYGRRRQALLQMYRDLSFEAVAASAPALEALDYVVRLQDQFNRRVRAVQEVIKQATMTAPLEHLKRTRWKRHALDGEDINSHYYEMAAWQRLKDDLRAGDIAVLGSPRYQAFDSYLFAADEWQQLQIQNQTRLVVTADVETYLTDCQEQLEALLKQMEQAIDAGERIAVDADGSLHLKRAGKTTPDETKGWRQRLDGPRPPMQLAEVIIEVDGWTNFLQMFTHLTTGEPADGDNKRALVATLMGRGLNLGLAQMAPATDFSEKQLTWIADWHLREDTLQQAQVLLDNFVLHHPYSRHWGQGTTSSSGGLRVLVPVAAANAGYNARYFGFKRGVTIVTHAADIWMPCESVISNDAQEALHVIDALCHHETDSDIQEHYTDSGGATYHVFALCMMLGFRFAPRLRSAAEQYLYTVNPISVAQPLQPLLKGTVDTDLIHENWAEMRRLAASIRHGRVSAALIMRKLAAYPRQHRLAQAFSEVGKLERSLFLLQYLPDEAWQQHIRRELNKGEAMHALARALAFGRSGDLYEYELAAQMNRASSLMLLMSIISVWNTVYLDRVVTALQAQGVEVPSEYLAHISPLAWGHINLLGKYEIDLNQTFPLNQLRSLPFLSASL